METKRVDIVGETHLAQILGARSIEKGAEFVATARLAGKTCREIIQLLEVHGERAPAMLAREIGAHPKLTRAFCEAFLDERRDNAEEYPSIEAFYNAISDEHKPVFVKAALSRYLVGTHLKGRFLQDGIRYFKEGKLIPDGRNDLVLATLGAK